MSSSDVIPPTCLQAAKAAPLKLAQTRLSSRTHRPDIELCSDPPHHLLGRAGHKKVRMEID